MLLCPGISQVLEGQHTFLFCVTGVAAMLDNVALPWHQPSSGRTTRICNLFGCCFSRVKQCCLALAWDKLRKEKSKHTILCDWCCSHIRQCYLALASAKFKKDSTLFVVVAVLATRGCTSGGVHVLCIYLHARWELPEATQVFVIVIVWRLSSDN